MSTRGFLTFVVDGVEKTSYNHSDSYPDGLGNDVLSWLWANRHELTCDIHSGVVDSSVDLIRKLRVVDSRTSTPTPEDVERLRPYANTGVGSRAIDDWYVLLHRTQGDPAAILNAGVMEDAHEFPADSLFAEWGYVVDVDAQTFEVYRGFQKAPHDKGRFAGREIEPRSATGQQYYPVALVASWPLDKLPSEEDFIKTIFPDAEQE